ncbi:hypothetical protein [Polyangium sp. 6x1]|uniref:hypothetical protein n=1 Tax=Polyangium sp. 6x1 TaxID=3042689 RepID=UPI002482A8A3|nr:hypothetical protein [Polyangium sp. 6x1]MDI1444935.1 hypothetical protein [Polyangium sp. 6x1]
MVHRVDLVGYHNTEKMGYSILTGKVPFGFYTNKSVSRYRGARVWSIAGIDQPRKYFLADCFIIDKIERSDHEAFANLVRGRKGKAFRDTILLNDYPWFVDFRNSQANFSLGLSPIASKFVRRLEALAPEAICLRAR